VLAAHDPHAALGRLGAAWVVRGDGRRVRSAAALAAGERVRLATADGAEVEVEVVGRRT